QLLASSLADTLPPAPVYTLSLHDALPIWMSLFQGIPDADLDRLLELSRVTAVAAGERIITEGEPGDAMYAILDGELEVTRRERRSEEHTSELQSRENLVWRLLLEKTNRSN